MSDAALAHVLHSFFQVQDEPWMEQAACRGMGPGLFFLDRGQSPRPGKRICARCLVTGACGEYAYRSGSEDGIWGGEVISRSDPDQSVAAGLPTVSEAPAATLPKDQEVQRVIPKSFSASAFLKFMECEAGYRATSFDKVPELSSSAASLGTACHAAMETWVADGHYLQGYPDEWPIMKGLWDQAYWAEFSDASRYKEGEKLVKNWLARQDWSNREVLSTEVKRNFVLNTSAGPIPVNYIMDRMDRLRADGAIEVVDYKSLSRPVQPEDLKQKIQSRLYALAAQMEYPDAERIWVTFDMLRYDPIGIVFTKEENRATYIFIRELAERIIASEGTAETINDGCRWCIRKSICVELSRHAAAGGSVGISDPKLAAARSFRLKNAIAAMKNDADEMDKIVLAFMEQADMAEMETDDYEVAVKISGRRAIDSERLLQVVGADIMSRYANVNITSVDTMLKTEPLTDGQKSQIRQLFRTNYSEPSLVVKPKSPF